MKSRIISVDLATDVFELATANARHRILERHRLSRAKFSRLLTEHPPALVLLEACGTAHYWARQAMPWATRLASSPPSTSNLIAGATRPTAST